MLNKYDYDERQLAAQSIMWRNTYILLVALLLIDACLVSNIYPWTIYPEDRVFILVMTSAIVGIFIQIKTESLFPKGKVFWPVIIALGLCTVSCFVMMGVSIARNEPFITNGQLDTGALFAVLAGLSLIGFLACLIAGIQEIRQRNHNS
ncbi:MAG: hypothetical protein LBR20_03275 [Propionibacteriaceae bacterium]|jgi:hypothetical protein|nr:hypothetical protein [Propionibacteriaceae bacterium]